MNFILFLVFYLTILVALYIPYIIFMGIFTMIVWIITTKKIPSKILKSLIIIVILLYATIIIGGFKSETPDNIYTKIKEMNDNQTLIGLSTEEVIKLLGNPKHEYNRKEYVYFAGEIFKESYWGCSYSHEYYELYVSFDEHGKVKHTLMKLIP